MECFELRPVGANTPVPVASREAVHQISSPKRSVRDRPRIPDRI